MNNKIINKKIIKTKLYEIEIKNIDKLDTSRVVYVKITDI